MINDSGNNSGAAKSPNVTAIKPKLLTVCFLVEGNRVLLGMKKRGFGAGRWNGFGGKLNDDETIFDAARREFKEEAFVTVNSLDNRGSITFIFEGKPQPLEVHIFVANHHLGEPKESEEMRPQWFSLNEIPYDEMWPDDKLWLKQILAGKSIKATINLGANDAVLSHNIKFFDY